MIGSVRQLGGRLPACDEILASCRASGLAVPLLDALTGAHAKDVVERCATGLRQQPQQHPSLVSSVFT